MTPEHEALVAERKSIDPKGTPNLARKWMDRAVDAIESLSAQSAQPQAGEPVGAFEYCDGCSGYECGPTKGCAYPDVSPQPANPAQVTDALKSAEKALRPFYDAVFNDNGDMTVSGPYGHEEAIAGYFAHKKVERALAAIGAESEEEAESQWRDLALQFDGHRIQAICLLRAIAADKAGKAEIEVFLSAAALSGEQVLADRIAAIGAGGQAVAVKPRLTESMMRAACKAHFGTENIDGVCITVKDADWTFREAFKRMWRGALSAAPQPRGK